MSRNEEGRGGNRRGEEGRGGEKKKEDGKEREDRIGGEGIRRGRRT